MKAKRDLTIGLNEVRRAKQMKINIEDAQRKTILLESEVEQIVSRWLGKIAFVQKAIEEDQHKN